MLNYSAVFPVVVGHIGEPEFGMSLLTLVRELYGADHCAIFLLTGSAPREISSSSFDGTDTAHRRASKYVEAQLWKRDPTMSEAWLQTRNSAPRLVKLDFDRLTDSELRNHIYPSVAERVLLCGSSAVGNIALSMVKSGSAASLSAEAAADIERSAPLLLSMIGKHASIVLQKANLNDALTSLTGIEAVILQSSAHFPRREAQVCARILYGIYTTGIALELGISEETVTTYRKRIYARLGIGTQRELMLWYIRRWSESSQPSLATAPPLTH